MLINGKNVIVDDLKRYPQTYPTYYDNLATVLDERFKARNDAFTYSGSTDMSIDGLNMQGFGSVISKACTQMMYGQYITRFVYSEDCVFGLFCNGGLVFVDTDAKTLNSANISASANTLPSTISQSENITDDFVVGYTYQLKIDMQFAIHTAAGGGGGQAVRATLRCENTGSETTLADGSIGFVRNAKDFGVFNFDGDVTVKQLMYRAPNFPHAKCLTIGDSISLGPRDAQFDAGAWTYKVVSNHFKNSGVMSARGGDSAGHVVDIINDLYSQGWTFDYIIIALGTNNWNPLAVNHTKAENKQATMNWLESLDNLVSEHDGTLLWCACPMASADGQTSTWDTWETIDVSQTGEVSRVLMRQLYIQYFGDRCIRHDWATMTDGEYDSTYSHDGSHTNALGQQRQYEFAEDRLTALNYF